MLPSIVQPMPVFVTCRSCPETEACQGCVEAAMLVVTADDGCPALWTDPVDGGPLDTQYRLGQQFDEARLPVHARGKLEHSLYVVDGILGRVDPFGHSAASSSSRTGYRRLLARFDYRVSSAASRQRQKRVRGPRTEPARKRCCEARPATGRQGHRWQRHDGWMGGR